MLISTNKGCVALLQVSSGSLRLTIPREYAFTIHDCPFDVYAKEFEFEKGFR